MNHHFSDEYQEHLKKEHHQNAFTEYLKEIVYGGNDGIVTTFAVVAGFAGAQSTGSIVGVGGAAVLLFGLANLFADATSMGLGNYLALRSETDLYTSARKKEIYEGQHNQAFEYQETLDILKFKGISESDAKAFADLYVQNPDFWADFMMNHELGMADPSSGNPIANGLATFCAFLFFGAAPLVPYFFWDPEPWVFHWATGCAFGALVLLGVLRAIVTREKYVRCIGETILVGTICGVVAFLVGTFFA